MTEPAPGTAEQEAPRVWRPILEALAVLTVAMLLIDMVREQWRQDGFARVSQFIDEGQRPVEGESSEAQTERMQSAAAAAGDEITAMMGQQAWLSLLERSVLLLIAVAAAGLAGGGLGCGRPSCGPRLGLLLGSGSLVVGGLMLALMHVPWPETSHPVLAWLMPPSWPTVGGGRSSWALLPENIAVVTVVAAVLVLPLAHELFFRGFVQRRLLLRLSPGSAVILTAATGTVAFAGTGKGFSILLLAGLWLGYVAWRAGSTWASVACHALISAMLTAAYLLGWP